MSEPLEPTSVAGGGQPTRIVIQDGEEPPETAPQQVPAEDARSGEALSDTVSSDEAPTDDEAREESEPEPDKRKRVIRSVIEWAAVISGALLVALLVKTFLIQAFWIPSPSMNPTLVEGDRVLVNKLADDLSDIHRGDIIVFKRPADGNGQHPESEINDLIKRVIGLPGDKVEAENGIVFVNGERVDESYLADGTATSNLPPTVVPDEHVFVMGDNRGNSHDSRVFGPVPGDNIVGRAFLRVWPLSKFGRL